MFSEGRDRPDNSEFDRGSDQGRDLRIWLSVGIIVACMVVLTGGAFVAGYITGSSRIDPRLNAFWEAWQIADRDFFYTKPSEEERIRGAITGMLSTFNDPHTLYLPPVVAETTNREMSGEVGGIGAIVAQTEDNRFVITEVRIGMPAEQAGMRPGDQIVQVEDTAVDGKTINEVVALIRGPLNTDVQVTVARPDEIDPITFTLNRAQTNVHAEMIEPGIAYLSLSTFNRTSPDNMRIALERLMAQNPRALILDLRGNPGGYLDESTVITDLFLKDGPIAHERLSDGSSESWEAKPGDVAEDIPLYILVNGGSASASEIVAGALQDRGRAILIGQRTYGKGSVQVLYSLSDGGQLRVTHGAWFTPNETPLQVEGQPIGLVPDVIVEVPTDPNQVRPGVDPILEAALETIRKTLI
jgi:carboxyl-terminal processing protease